MTSKAARAGKARAPETQDRSETDTVAFDVTDGVAWVRFNRPEKRNCMSPKLNRQMMRVLEELEFREDVLVLVLSGEGASWSAGMDLKEYFRETEAEGLPGVRRMPCRLQRRAVLSHSEDASTRSPSLPRNPPRHGSLWP